MVMKKFHTSGREVPEKVSLPKDFYIANQIEYENLKFLKVTLQHYVAEHKHLDRDEIGKMLGLSKEILEKGGIDDGIQTFRDSGSN